MSWCAVSRRAWLTTAWAPMWSPYWGWYGPYGPWGDRMGGYDPNASSARLQVKPKQAEVYVDGELVATTPTATRSRPSTRALVSGPPRPF